jgi:hypothetical protein
LLQENPGAGKKGNDRLRAGGKVKVVKGAMKSAAVIKIGIA